MGMLKSKRSGGPRSLSGKLNASRNSLKTGAYSKSIVLPNESEEDFEKFISAYLDSGSLDPYERVIARRDLSKLQSKWGAEKNAEIGEYLRFTGNSLKNLL